MTLKAITDELISALTPLTFSEPVTHVYNPLIYARAAWEAGPSCRWMVTGWLVGLA